MGVSKPTDQGVARPSDQPNVVGPGKKKPPFSRFAEDLAAREAGFRAGAYDLVNMQTPLVEIATATNAPAPINPEEIPAVRGLANMYAVAKEGSTQREKRGTAQIKALPKYVNAYRSYLRWRYPNKYGGKGGGSSLSPIQPGGGYEVPDLPNIGDIPMYGG